MFVRNCRNKVAFDASKDEIMKTPVLDYFDRNKSNIIQADASMKGLGAILLHDGQLVIYTSRSLTLADHRYSNIERELLSIVFAMERLHHFVYG